jgi:hypothetical protein
MRKQRLIACGVVLIGAVTVGTAVAQGGPPGAGSAAAGKPPHAGKPDDKGKDAPGKADAAPGKALEAHGKPDKDKGADKDKPEAAGEKAGGPHGKGRAMRALLDDLKAGKIKKGELKEHLGKLRGNMAERRAQHQSELKARWGAALAMPSARQELEHHARRMARLNRALLLAETEVTKDKDKLVERIQKLIDKEQERHERAMARVKSMPSTPAASAAPAPSAATALGGEK